MSLPARMRWVARRPPAGVATAASAIALDDFSPPLQTRLLVLQPTPFCNIDCDYCYLPDRNSAARMSLATVRRAAERLRDDGLTGAALTVVWHAGEPLVMPKAFYEDAAELLDVVFDGACEVSHSIQTNATLIDDAWCELFVRRGFRIGVSVDGPAALHDAHRRTRTGRGTHERVMRGMAALRAHGIPFHAIAVVTTATFTQADAFFDFFVAQGVTEVGCNFDEAEGTHAASSLAGNEAAHAGFVERLLERQAGAPSPLRVRELEMALRLIAEPLPAYRWRGRSWPTNAQTQPFALITVAHNGNFCTFSPELLGQPSVEFGDFVLGNVATSGFLESSRGALFQRMLEQVARGTVACERECAHFGFCGGGAPANKLYEHGTIDSAETLYCRTMIKRPFDAVLERLERTRPSARRAEAANG